MTKIKICTIMVYRNSGNFYSYSSFRGWYVLPTKINLPEIKINIASVLPSGAPYEIKKKLIYENFQNYGITKSPICLVLLESITF